jgi:hypothetical protein
MSGWIVLARGWRDDEVFDDLGPLSEREAWIWLLEKAAWKTCYRRNAKGERITVERGQFHTSLRNLGKAWAWGKWKVGRYLGKLTEYDMIRTVTGQSGILITICNYSKYQDAADSRENKDRTVTGQSPDTQEQRKQDIPISKEIGEVNSDKKFWADATAYLGPKSRGIIGKWLKNNTQTEVAGFIAAAQVERAVAPIAFIEGCVRRNKKARSDDLVFAIT